MAIIRFRNNPAYVQQYINTLSKPFRKFAYYYINNKVIFLKTGEEYAKQLYLIFSLFLKKIINLSFTKSWMRYNNIKFLGFYINGFGLLNIKKRIATFTNLNLPTILK